MNKDSTMLNCDLHRVVDFNFFPALDFDDSWWQSNWLAIPLFKRLVSIQSARHKLSAFILDSYQLRKEIYCDFSDYEKRAALLTGTDLKALLYYIGLIVESDTIAQAIEKKSQQEIKQSLREADYLYALKNRISMRSPQTDEKTTVHDKENIDFADFKNRVYRSGLRCLLSLLGDMPPDFIQRILFKLPRVWSTPPLSADQYDYHAIKVRLPHLFKELKLP